MKDDAQLQQDVIAELSWEPSVNAAQIGVSAKDAIITLAAHVDSWAERESASHSTWGTPGVRNVDDRIRVSF
jgi:osmotically-inducible protein OsmY